MHRSESPLPLPTLGGLQFWTDLRIHQGWRVQQNVLTGGCRLLDAREIRRASGSFEACLAAFEQHAPPLPVGTREMVVVLHGLGRTRRAMQPMVDHLADKGFETLNLGYASTRADIDAHAAALAEVLGDYPPHLTVHVVGHSLGNLIVRRYLHRRRVDEVAGPRIGRMVMLAPPNNGSALAARLNRSPLFRLGFGPAGVQIARWEDLEHGLATPKAFIIIAGRAPVLNPLVDGAGDLVVSVEETRLEGATAMHVVDASHTFIMRRPEVLETANRFLRGYDASKG